MQKIIILDKENNLLLDFDESEESIVNDNIDVRDNNWSMVVKLKNVYYSWEDSIKVTVVDGELMYKWS